MRTARSPSLLRSRPQRKVNDEGLHSFCAVDGPNSLNIARSRRSRLFLRLDDDIGADQFVDLVAAVSEDVGEDLPAVGANGQRWTLDDAGRIGQVDSEAGLVELADMGLPVRGDPPARDQLCVVEHVA